MKLKSAILILTAGILLASCGGKSSNRKIKEAGDLHQAIMMKYDSVYHILIDEKERVTSEISTMSAGDSRRSAYESMLRSIDRGIALLDGWESAVVGVPGMESVQHHHHHGDGHHHHHNDNSALLKGLSDQEILDLQKAYSVNLNEVVKEINTLLETIQMYDAHSSR